ncbi:MAG: GNAT family N-acetyltransferase [Oscillospiraceae bacterium]|jgi:ribosomal protein S18 acetylase RimI-like enzyme|nr:GNAT family N-acetyltransferase [Oscillospiraceae bacterium]
MTADFTPAQFAAACDADVLGAQIYAGWCIHTPSPLDTPFWLQQSGGQCTAALGFIDSRVTISATPAVDKPELRAFLAQFAVQEIHCTVALAAQLALTVREHQYIQQIVPPPASQSAPSLTDEQLRDVYALLRTAGFRDLPMEYGAWLSTLGRRQRLGVGDVFALYQGTELLATAQVCARTASRAFLGSVAVREAARGQGLGIAVVREALGHANRPVAELLCAAHNRGFYSKCGFHEVGEALRGTLV